MQNFGRQYQFTFFDVNKDNSITQLPNAIIQNTVNFSFTYNVVAGVFNTAKFYFYNLSVNTSNLFASKKNRRGFFFRCAYDNINNLPQSLIFRGLTYRVNTYREGPDLITEVTACDAFFNLQQATIKTLNFGTGTSVSIILQRISEYLGIFTPVIGSDFLTIKPIYQHPLSFSNVSVIEILDMIAADNSCTWGFDYAGLKFSPLPNNPDYNSLGTITPTPLISRDTGLVGNVRAENLSIQLFPVDYFSEQRLQYNHPFITATILLRPIPLFSQINLKCEITALNGTYRVYSIVYQGEYRGNNWYTTLKLTPIVNG